MQIEPLKRDDLGGLVEFTDAAIGKNYYSLKDVEDIFARSQKNGIMCTLVVKENSKIKGVRITYPPGNWEKGKGKGLTPNSWNTPLSDTAYFQSLFLSSDLQGHGLGQEISLKSIALLKTLGAKAVVCHSWKESPNDSSGKYLRKMGFQLVATHPLYWKEVDYQCTRCGKPCLCTAEEMIYYF